MDESHEPLEKKIPLRVNLLGETFEFLGDVDSDQANEIVQYVDRQMNHVAKTSTHPLTPSTKSKVAVLACLNLAEELFKERRHWREKTKELTEILEQTLKEQIPKMRKKIPKES